MATSDVVVLGVGLTKFGRDNNRSLYEMGREAGLLALEDAGMGIEDIQMGFVSHVQQAPGIGGDVFGEMGMTGIPVTRVELACGSGTRAVVLLAEMISHGVCDVGMVIGLEKMPPGMVPITGGIDDMPYQLLMGLLPLPGIYAMQMQRHMNTYGSKVEHFVKAAEKSHRNASLAPYATYRDVFTMDDIYNSPMIADPLTRLMCSPNTNGASAVVLCSRAKAKQFSANPVNLAGWTMGSPVYDKEMGSISEGPTEKLGQQLYEKTGLGPEDVDVMQVHDGCAPGEIFALEELGICRPGDGAIF